MGIYYPFFRGHAHLETTRREPWLFGPESTARIRTATGGTDVVTGLTVGTSGSDINLDSSLLGELGKERSNELLASPRVDNQGLAFAAVGAASDQCGGNRGKAS